jgi:hypothetical protein
LKPEIAIQLLTFHEQFPGGWQTERSQQKRLGNPDACKQPSLDFLHKHQVNDGQFLQTPLPIVRRESEDGKQSTDQYNRLQQCVRFIILSPIEMALQIGNIKIKYTRYIAELRQQRLELRCA